MCQTELYVALAVVDYTQYAGLDKRVAVKGKRGEVGREEGWREENE